MTKQVDLEKRVSDKMRIVECYSLAGSAAATAANHPVNLFTAPFPCRIESVVAKYGTASSSGTLQINKAPSGTATASGTACLSSTMSLSGTATNNVVGVPHPNNSVLNTGDTIGIATGGTLTSLADLGVTIVIVAL